jgi:hypothetical protein
VLAKLSLPIYGGHVVARIADGAQRGCQSLGAANDVYLSAFPPPSPPAEKATARQDQAGKTRTGDGAGSAKPSAGMK